MSVPLPRLSQPPDPTGPRWLELHAAMLDIVIAGGDLAQVAALAAEHTGGTVAVVVPSAGLAAAWPNRGKRFLPALRRYVSQRLEGEPAPVPDGLELELPVVAGGEQLGLVALLDTRRPPDGAAQILQLTVAATVVALALDGSAPQRERLGAGLVADLLDRAEAPPAAEVAMQARRMGSELSAGALACCALPRELPHRAEASIRSAFPDALVLHREGRVHALLPAGDDDRQGARASESALRLAERLDPATPFALAPFEPDPERLGPALREAALAATAVAGGTASPHELYSGTFRLLLRLTSEHPREVRRLHAQTVGPIVEYDERHGTDILATLAAYLGHDCNMKATAAAIFAHRHTVAYRLERARELTGLDPLRHADREQLGIGLKAHALLGCAAERHAR